MLRRPSDRQFVLDQRFRESWRAPEAGAQPRVRILIGAGASLLLVLHSCGTALEASFDSPEPAARNSAIVRAGARQDREAVPDLVRMLGSDDPATRLLAIEALNRITGERLGFEPHAGPQDREASVERWRAFANDFRPRSVITSNGGIQ